MRRGFKAEAERLAARIRDQAGLPTDSPVDIHHLAQHLKIDVVPADALVNEASLRELEALQPGAFSAATFHLPNRQIVAVFNPFAEPARTRSDIAHELAHILLDHDVRELQRIAGYPFLTCNPEQEEEANWLAGCLLLPRPLLLKEAFAGADAATVARRHGVTLAMARFRLNTSGVLLQVQRARTTGRPSSA